MAEYRSYSQILPDLFEFRPCTLHNGCTSRTRFSCGQHTVDRICLLHAWQASLSLSLSCSLLLTQHTAGYVIARLCRFVRYVAAYTLVVRAAHGMHKVHTLGRTVELARIAKVIRLIASAH